MTVEFYLEDAGDGWWHCSSPMRATVIDGPAAKFEPRAEARFPEEYWLVEVDPPIVWHGDQTFAARWGPDHPLCHPIEPTRLALVMASSPWTGPIEVKWAGVPVYPVVNSARTVGEAEIVSGLAVKAGLRAARQRPSAP
ncbi:MAG TPA: hypothetical protein VMP67_06680 [Candidatus Limnocylindria bacterium]|nr:hypothetical protein [Candidatus Limnocylindria bacterium]